MALKSKLSRLLADGEPGLSDPPLDHAALKVDASVPTRSDGRACTAHMVGALGGAVAGQLVVFAAGTSAVSGS